MKKIEFIDVYAREFYDLGVTDREWETLNIDDNDFDPQIDNVVCMYENEGIELIETGEWFRLKRYSYVDENNVLRIVLTRLKL